MIEVVNDICSAMHAELTGIAMWHELCDYNI